MANPSMIAATGAGPIPTAELETLRGSLRGQSCLKGDPGYDEARTLWNSMVDRAPSVIVRCAGAADVVRAIDFAGRHGLTIAVRGGGHNIAGNAVCDGGLVIDLSPMKSVRVDPEAKRAWVAPGCTLADVDRETQAFGLVVPTGINSTTGIAGLTIGGGFGWTTRRFGMTIDNLMAADVVTSDGRLRRASASENPDLFWAIRGGGGNFGVVTNFEFRLHPLGPEVVAGLVVHPFDRASDLLKEYREAAAAAPDELTCWAVMRKAPPLPFLPADWHGREILAFAMCYAGDPDKGEAATRQLRSIGQPIADVVGRQPFVAWQSAFDPLLTPGARNYWKSHDFDKLSNDAIAALIEGVRTLPGPECEVFMAHVGGAMSRVAPDATAYPHRASHFIMNVHTRWREAGDDGAFIAWARRFFGAMAPFATGSAYVNFMPDDEADRIEKVYGRNYQRLREVKKRYDPENRLRMNQNIQPPH
jgi:FAD/FMN-containing dehydrogenase